MAFNVAAYGSHVARILAIDGGGERLMPLVAARCSLKAANELKKCSAATLFPDAPAPAEALAGLWVYFSGFEQAHTIVQDLATVEANLWHAILHRQEPDSWNSSYWFRQVGSHRIFPELASAAAEIAARHPGCDFRPSETWDPIAFVSFCDRAREQPGTPIEAAAREIQRAEWQLLFDSCARRAG